MRFSWTINFETNFVFLLVFTISWRLLFVFPQVPAWKKHRTCFSLLMVSQLRADLIMPQSSCQIIHELFHLLVPPKQVNGYWQTYFYQQYCFPIRWCLFIWVSWCFQWLPSPRYRKSWSLSTTAHMNTGLLSSSTPRILWENLCCLACHCRSLGSDLPCPLG